MLLLEQPSSGSSFVPSQLSSQQAFSLDYLDVEADLAAFVAEEDLKFSQATLEFLASEAALLEMFQVRPPRRSSRNLMPGHRVPCRFARALARRRTDDRPLAVMSAGDRRGLRTHE